MQNKIDRYVRKWQRQGYQGGISDEVPSALMADNLAPSYKAIALAILKNDHNLTSLGFTPKASPWYEAIKHAEISKRTTDAKDQHR